MPSKSHSLMKGQYYHLVATYQNCRIRGFLGVCTQWWPVWHYTKNSKLEKAKQYYTYFFVWLIGNKSFFPALSCYFKHLSHESLPKCLGCTHAGWEQSQRFSCQQVCGGRGTWLTTDRPMTEQRQSLCLGTWLIFMSTSALPCLPSLSKEVHLTLSCFVLFFTQTKWSARSRCCNECKVPGRTTFDKCKQYA